MDDRWVHDESNATDVPRRYLISADTKSPVAVLTYVGYPAPQSMTSCATQDFYASHRLSYQPTSETAELGVQVEALPYGPFHKLGNPIVAKQRE
ncbi:unnamed protein product [Nippostrongylus brasiliensis]|uniref:Sulfatase domain-containing protein n=1 Tax=Nippostrongylus brasiliensis TaxID=27835 RepID=A0A0N4XUZ1_NIPBR|nr:unnamed protein product [Nippostrongylus brasiliensis]